MCGPRCVEGGSERVTGRHGQVLALNVAVTEVRVAVRRDDLRVVVAHRIGYEG